MQHEGCGANSGCLFAGVLLADLVCGCINDAGDCIADGAAILAFQNGLVTFMEVFQLEVEDVRVCEISFADHGYENNGLMIMPPMR